MFTDYLKSGFECQMAIRACFFAHYVTYDQLGKIALALELSLYNRYIVLYLLYMTTTLERQ